jgi:endo-1,4-beta-xylanase
MKNKLIPNLSVLLFAILFASCTKDDKIITNPGFTSATDTAGTLKGAADIPIGVAIDYSPATTNATYMNLVKNEFDGVTFSYNMKHGAIVQDNGTLNFTNADAMVNACGTGLEVFGHALGWHENQNATYLKNYAQLVASTGPNQLAANGGFENGPAGSNDGWYVYNSNGATVSVGSGANEVRTGTRSMKVLNPTAFGGDQWKVQVASDLVNTTPGDQVTISYWVKAAAAGGSTRLSTQNAAGGGAQYQGDQNIGTAWQEVRWNITANSAQTRFFLDMGAAANTYFIDDVTVTGLVVANTDPVKIAAKLDTALGLFVTGMVNRYKARVKSWDVINELFDNSGNIRNNGNSPNSNNANDYFVWSNYMGRDFAFKAFKYAQAADPAATLFINDYGLESNPTKLDSLIKYVTELKTRGAKVDGIGTQMHINYFTKHDGIDAMMQKLAGTGLKIRISELDVRVNPDLRGGYVFTPLESFGQEEMYKYVIKSYLKYIPKAQQHGITVWGLTDNTSWLYNNGKDFPLLFNSNYSKKTAYGAATVALKGL